MGVYKWSDEEFYILKNNYPFKQINELLLLIPNKTKEQIKSKAKVEKIKKVVRTKREITYFGEDDLITCIHCGNSYLFSEKMFKVNSKGITYKSCIDCNNKRSRIHDYQKLYGIVLDFNLYFNTFDILTWYKWTCIEKTPNGKFLNHLPRELINEENITKIARFVIGDILKFATREDVLNFSQPIMNKYKIGFSKTDFILNSPIKLVNLAFPEYNIKSWELNHASKDYWKDYNNFIDCTIYYYKSLCQEFKENEIASCFENKFMENVAPKLLRAKEIYYNDLSWKKITTDAGLIININDDRRIAYDNVKLNSIEEKLIYNFIHLQLGITSLLSVGMKRKGKFIFTHKDGKYIPDFVIPSMNNKENLIIEYFGLIKNLDSFKDKESSVYNNLLIYKDKTNNKIDYYKENEIKFIALYPDDLKNNLLGVRNKLKDYIS